MADRTQRWRERRDSFRQRGEGFNPSAWGVEPIPDDTTAREFVERHHYSRSYPAARCRVGLYRCRAFLRAELVGVCVFSVGVSDEALPAVASGLTADAGVTLGRFVLLDEAPFNAESWFLARAFPILASEKPGIRAVLSYSDPEPQVDADGRVTMPGHVGTIYQAKGARYTGRTGAEWFWYDARGPRLDPRSLAKVRNEEAGGESYERHLVALGADPRWPGESPRAWINRILPSGRAGRVTVTRAGPFVRRRHPGNHRYLFDVRGGVRALPAGEALPYPKRDREAA